MTDPPKRSSPVKLLTQTQVSAGGIAFRQNTVGLEIAIISVGDRQRWQLPKGLVNVGETPQQAAVREVREETGLATQPLSKIDTVEYWYVGDSAGQRVRFHKFVHFFLLAYVSGDVEDHDHEVNEARWVSLEQGLELLAFKNERAIVQRAQEMIVALDGSKG